MVMNTLSSAEKSPRRGQNNDLQTSQLPNDIISKIVAITSRDSDATVKRKKDGYKVYETKLVEK